MSGETPRRQPPATGTSDRRSTFALALSVVSVADCLSLARIPLGLVFLLVAGDRPWAMAVLLVAAVTDVLDGWVARRCGPRRPGESHRGDWLDPLCDKLFAAAVVAGLLLTQPPPLALVFLFLARELLQLVAVMVMRMVPVLHRASRDYDFRAHPVGKAATVAQFATAAALVMGHQAAWPLAMVCAVLGVISVTIYIHRIRRLLADTPHVRRRA
jgi:cardiolipin synthase (CMP-forming)